MNTNSSVLPAAPLLLAMCIGACGIEQTDGARGDGTWVGTITTEGNVTTVVNESGSVWGGTAMLVEEASIGVESGPDEYMFGPIQSPYVSSERIYVIDRQVPVVRIYNLEGVFLGNIGRSGRGPGEYVFPSIVAADPSDRVFVFDSILARINVYSNSGEPIDTWPITHIDCCSRPMFPLSVDTLWVPARELLDTTPTEYRYGGQVVHQTDHQAAPLWVPDVEFQPVTYGDAEFEAATPFSPALVWNLTPAGGVIFGTSDKYRYETLRADGSTLVVERYWSPVAVPPEHADWERRSAVAFQRGAGRPAWSWDGSEIPGHKPAYRALVPAISGEIWVLREGTSERLTDCAEDPIETGRQAANANPCWTAQPIEDVFDEAGRYLGAVEVPQGMRLSERSMSISDQLVVATAQDSEGTIMVKRYRLVLPGEQ